MAVCVLLLSVLVACGGNKEISLSAASNHVGENKTLCGRVASAEYQLLAKSRPTFLTLTDSESHTFTAVIWGSARKNFPKAPEDVYRGKEVCVTGDIALYREEPHIMLTRPDQIQIKP